MDKLYWLSLLFVSAVWLWLAYRRRQRRKRRETISLVDLTEEMTGDLVTWLLLLLGVVFALGTLGAMEELGHLGGA
jgi:hypothetical protein